MPTTIVLTFDQALDPATAQDVHNYRIVSPQGHRIKVLRAVYNATNHSVTLHLAERLSVHHPYKLTVVGTGRAGPEQLAARAARQRREWPDRRRLPSRSSPGANWCSATCRAGS